MYLHTQCRQLSLHPVITPLLTRIYYFSSRFSLYFILLKGKDSFLLIKTDATLSHTVRAARGRQRTPHVPGDGEEGLAVWSVGALELVMGLRGLGWVSGDACPCTLNYSHFCGLWNAESEITFVLLWLLNLYIYSSKADLPGALDLYICLLMAASPAGLATPQGQAGISC